MTEDRAEDIPVDDRTDELMPHSRRLMVDSLEQRATLTHQLFRFPAKFHPPIVRALLDQYTSPGDVVLDPFCGSGTLMVEAAVSGRDSIGTDIDPLAAFVSRAKTIVHEQGELEEDSVKVLAALADADRGSTWYNAAMHIDLTDEQYRAETADLEEYIPEIPNISHWFRKYVVIDLARLRKILDTAELKASSKTALLLAFGAIIRNASNADPVPVSGLEVTRHMLEREEKGRIIDPFTLFRASVKKVLTGALAFSQRSSSEVRVYVGDATDISNDVPQVDAVITSPPYHNAVDYYRRHQLEMYWLGLVASHEERLSILPRYIGRQRVPAKNPLFKSEWLPGPFADKWESSIRADNPVRANDFRHYSLSMRSCFTQLALRMNTDSPLLMVVGRSRWNGQEIPTDELMEELAVNYFKLEETLWYPVVNRYMSYARRNNADISREYVLVFRRTD